MPFKTDALRRLRAANVPISEIVDVGVREETGELIEVFSDKRHHLFEPVSTFFPAIEKNYAQIQYKLHPLALSDTDGQIFLILLSQNADGIVTHSQVKQWPEPADGKRIVSCTPVSVRRFDGLGLGLPHNFLLKVDVDGLDLHVLRGFGEQIAKASVVVVEVTHNTMFERMRVLHEAGFRMLDFVDLTYYGCSLYQADLVMLRADLITPEVLPTLQPFQEDLWRPFHAGLIRAGV
jgi:FkbM family methyltransferase